MGRQVRPAALQDRLHADSLSLGNSQTATVAKNIAETAHPTLYADEIRQFDFISRACTPDVDEQQRLFNSLLKAENRRIEPWTASLLRLLNDRTREPLNNRYLQPALDALLDVQRTGDIFFPGKWLSALLSGHHSKEARQIVETFISQHPDYPDKLMNKIKENAYTLTR